VSAAIKPPGRRTIKTSFNLDRVQTVVKLYAIVIVCAQAAGQQNRQNE
jgi:hypothetical protein